MTRQLSDLEARLAAGAGLYDHLPPPMFTPPEPPSQNREEIRRLLERLAGPQELIHGPPHRALV